MSIALFLLTFLFPPRAVSTPVAQPPLFTASLPARPVSVLVPILPEKKAPQSLSYRVTATTYWPEVGQTDDAPMETADGSIIPTRHSSKTRWLAVSRDLLSKWGGPFRYGEKVQVSGISDALDGVYIIHDTMNRRHRHCVDVLVSERECKRKSGYEGRWTGIKLTKYLPEAAPVPEWQAG